MTSTTRDVFIGDQGSRAKPAFFSTSEKMYKIKTVLVGDISVGKTSLALRFVNDKFDESYKPTIGASFISKIVVLGDGCVVNFQIWDTAGQERYRSLVPMYLRGAHIAFVLYDVTNPESFTNVSFWLEALQHHGDMVKTVLVANKCDCESIVSEEIALSFAESHYLQFVQTSAKTGENVDLLFHRIGAKVVEEMKRVSKQFNPNDRLSLYTERSQSHEEEVQKEVKKQKKCC
ncbi:Ras-related protein Rab-21 [Mactra antiquata]